jgi:hypothetical protein
LDSESGCLIISDFEEKFAPLVEALLEINLMNSPLQLSRLEINAPPWREMQRKAMQAMPSRSKWWMRLYDTYRSRDM